MGKVIEAYKESKTCITLLKLPYSKKKKVDMNVFGFSNFHCILYILQILGNSSYYLLCNVALNVRSEL